ncbi:MAG: response regulator [Candidatus Omnitrophica bacterium]|nr:response regulator [Candidatus Omnitrophota bacterium]MBU1869477.1 response regulator [Candidatus Omnitrophota bacterium]
MRRILAVDDEIELGKIFEKFLTMKGFQVTGARSAEEALAVLDKENPDLIILDKKMPGMGGIGLLRELKNKESKIPVIIMTGSQELSGSLDEIKEMGYDDILIKPVDLNLLLEAVNKRLPIG